MHKTFNAVKRFDDDIVAKIINMLLTNMVTIFSKWSFSLSLVQGIVPVQVNYCTANADVMLKN